MVSERQAEFERLYSTAATAIQSGDSIGAAHYFSKAARFAPDLWCDMAAKFPPEDEELALKHFHEALLATDVAAFQAGALNEIGRILANRGQNADAMERFQQAHQLNPAHPGIMTNLGLCSRWSGDLVAAERWLTRALRVNPWEHSAQLEMAFVHLLRGDYLTGFAEYESRWRCAKNNLKKIECVKPEWDGAEIRGEGQPRKLFVYGEQGSGDIFLMLRYARLIRALGMRQCWVVHTTMKPLVELMPEIDEVIVSGQQAPEFDCHLPAASLPHLFRTTLRTIPSGEYIPRPTAKDYGHGFHVGIAWRGSRVQLNDRIRSTNLDQWRPVLDAPGVTFHSLQVDGSEEGLVYPVLNMEPNPVDWLETAARVAGLDLVISVDSSPVHLAGAMGVPCWCALHCRPYFVFPLVCENTPWYPSVRLFKQRKEFEWQPVFETIAKELCNLAAS